MSMSVRFKEATAVVTSLEVQDPRRITSLEELYGILLGIRVQLVTATELDAGGLRVFELSICELDGGKLDDARRRAVLAELSVVVAEAPDREPPAPRTTSKPLRAA